MTAASLAMPEDPHSERSGAAPGARQPRPRRPRALPPKPAIPAALAAAEGARAAESATPDASTSPRDPDPPAAPRALTKPPPGPLGTRSSEAAVPVVRTPDPTRSDPGPPPTLAADATVLVIPPMPPPPLVVESSLIAELPEVEDEPPVLVAELPEVEDEPPVVVDEPTVVTETPREATIGSVFETGLGIDDFAEAVIPALSVRGVTKSFAGTRAVDGVDLTVPAGTFYGLVGPNGAGKTTTLSIIAGMLRADRGSIVVNGVDAAAHPRDAKRLMGVLPDRLRTFDRLTGRQLLYYCGVLRGLAAPVVDSRIADLARAFDLVEALGRPVSDYSAGMTKKVMLAGAMIHSPRLLVLDEPFESVDPVSSAVILDILGAYVAHGGTVILSSHGMELVERVCSRVAVIVAGQVLAEGTVEEVRGELTLEQRFIELAGGIGDTEGLEWLHTFSG